MSTDTIATKALEEMAAVAVRPYAFPEDWSEQVKACSECQRYKGHPIQQGICDAHRRPLLDREAHDSSEFRLLSVRRLKIAEDALREISREHDLQKATPE